MAHAAWREKNIVLHDSALKFLGERNSQEQHDNVTSDFRISNIII